MDQFLKTGAFTKEMMMGQTMKDLGSTIKDINKKVGGINKGSNNQMVIGEENSHLTSQQNYEEEYFDDDNSQGIQKN